MSTEDWTRVPRHEPRAPARVRVTVDPRYADEARERGYDTEPFDAELLPGVPWMFWHRVRPLGGRHAAPLDLPPMFRVERIEP